MFVTFEGLDGSGKTTQKLTSSREWLEADGRRCPLATRERGGTESGSGSAISSCTAGTSAPWAEPLLYAASRAQHVEEVIGPALERGRSVLLRPLHRLVGRVPGGGARPRPRPRAGPQPDRGRRLLPTPTFLSTSTRRSSARACDPSTTGWRARTPSFTSAPPTGYRELAERFPERIVVLDGTRPQRRSRRRCMEPFGSVPEQRRPSACSSGARRGPAHAYLLHGPPAWGSDGRVRVRGRAARRRAAGRGAHASRPVPARAARGDDPHRRRPRAPARPAHAPVRGRPPRLPRSRRAAHERGRGGRAARGPRGAAPVRDDRARRERARAAAADDPLALPAGAVRRLSERAVREWIAGGRRSAARRPRARALGGGSLDRARRLLDPRRRRAAPRVAAARVVVYRAHLPPATPRPGSSQGGRARRRRRGTERPRSSARPDRAGGRAAHAPAGRGAEREELFAAVEALEAGTETSSSSPRAPRRPQSTRTGSTSCARTSRTTGRPANAAEAVRETWRALEELNLNACLALEALFVRYPPRPPGSARVVVGLVGCGRLGSSHPPRPRLARVRGAGRRALGRERRARARREERRRSSADVDVAARRSTAVVVATPTSDACRSRSRRCSSVGCPVFCEKPLTDDPESAARLAARAPDRLFVMDKWRYHPGVHELAAIARERPARRGRRDSRTVRVGWGNPHDDVDPVWVLAPHDLSIALEVLGACRGPEAAVGAVARRRRRCTLSALAARRRLVADARGLARARPSATRSVELHCDEGVAVLADGWDEHVTRLPRRSPTARWRSGSRRRASCRCSRSCARSSSISAVARRRARAPPRALRSSSAIAELRRSPASRDRRHDPHPDASGTRRSCRTRSRSALDQDGVSVEVFVVGRRGRGRRRARARRRCSDDPSAFASSTSRRARGTASSHRHEALREATRPHRRATSSDDDLLLRDHVAEMLRLLEDADFAHPVSARFGCRRLASSTSRGTTVAPRVSRTLGRGRKASIGLTGTAHTLEAYRRLPVRVENDAGRHADRPLACGSSGSSLPGFRGASWASDSTYLAFPEPIWGQLPEAERTAIARGLAPALAASPASRTSWTSCFADAIRRAAEDYHLWARQRATGASRRCERRGHGGFGTRLSGAQSRCVSAACQAFAEVAERRSAPITFGHERL